MKSQLPIKWQWPLLGLASSSALAALFFYWALSSPLYEELQSILGKESYYTPEITDELSNIEARIDTLPADLQTKLYLQKVTQTTDGPERLKYIRLAIQATPGNAKSYDILYNFVEHIPVDFGIPGYLSRLYAHPGINRKKIASIAWHRLEIFDKPERQQRFLDGLSEALRDAVARLKPKNLKELNTQIRRNE